MDIAGGWKVLLARRQPTVARIGLTLWTVPVAARVERDGAIPAARTRIDMPAECRGTTGEDRVEDLQMQPGEPLPAALEEGFRRRAEDIGHLHGWPRHLLGVGRVRVAVEYGQRIQGAGRGAEVPLRKVEIDGRLFQVGMAQQHLNGAQVGAGFEQVSREAVPTMPHAA
jgi:hypothetical protein